MKKVLFIDDNELQHYLIRSEIEVEQIPLRPSFVFSPQEAMDYLEMLEQDNEEFPQLIIVDIMMPESGFDFVKEYEQKFFDHHRETKVYYLTQKPTSYFRIENLMSKSVFGFYSKPFTKIMFNEMIENEGVIVKVD